MYNLRSAHIIPLPEETTDPVVLLPALTGTLGRQGLVWDLAQRPWKEECIINLPEGVRQTPATCPPTRGPISIIVEGLPGPVIVMAEGVSIEFITIWGVIFAIYRAVRWEALRAQGLTHLQEYNQHKDEQAVTRAIHRHMQGMTQWEKLEPASECNVWNLCTKWHEEAT